MNVRLIMRMSPWIAIFASALTVGAITKDFWVVAAFGSPGLLAQIPIYWHFRKRYPKKIIEDWK
jgi:hypothetical protein